MRHKLLAFSILICTAFAARPAPAAVTVIAAGGASRSTNSYATPVVVAPVGGPLTFVNGDVQAHGLASDAIGPSTSSWCGFFADGACPLIWAPVTDAGFRTSTVLGLERATSGASYGLYCVVHPNVRGTLVTV